MAYTGRTPAAAPLTSGDIPDGSVTPNDLSTGAPSWDTNGKVTTGDGLTVGRGAGNVSTNTAVGASALDANTTGSENTAVGSGTLVSNQTGVSNTAVGRSALSGNTASNNTAVGRYSMLFNTTGADNSAIGSASLYQNTTGNYNTALGRSALYSNTTASNNTAVGYQAGYSNTAENNAFLSAYSGYSNTTGTQNTYVGRTAGYLGTSGSYNTFVGDNSGYYVTTGSKNTVVGMYNGNQGGLDIRTSSNQVVISDGDGNVRLHFNGNDMASAGVYGNTTATAANVAVLSSGIIRRSTSSIKYKREVQDATHGLAEVLQLRPVTYKGKSEGDGEIVFGGLIAEEVHDAGLTEFVQYAEDGSPDSLAYGNMVSLCIKAIQELKAEVDSLKAQLNP